MAYSFWKNDYRLDKMDLKELVFAYFTHYTIMAYLSLAILSTGLTIYYASSWAKPLLSIAAAIVIYPFAWYMLHRYVLHGRYLYRNPLTAKVWKRIHFDHHRDPHDLNVLFGALYTTLPTIALVTMPAGFLIGDAAGLWAALTAGLLITCFYEFNHCIQHLNYQPKYRFLKKMKRLHLQHHFHDENDNFGITNFIPDRLFRTYRATVKGRRPSETVFNLGYTKEEVRRYPWVARCTPDIDENEAIEKGVNKCIPRKQKEAA